MADGTNSMKFKVGYLTDVVGTFFERGVMFGMTPRSHRQMKRS